LSLTVTHFCISLLLVITLSGCSACTRKRSPPPQEEEQDKFAPISEALTVDLFFDATLSMKGFVSTQTSSAYQQTVPLLERVVIEGWNNGQARFYKFGDAIAPLPGRDYLEAAKPAFYGDKNYNKKTLIERVIDEAKPDHLTVIITDLFQTNADVNQLSNKLKQKFIANNLAIGVYAVRSQFNGSIYDVGPDSYSFTYRSGDKPASHRPFYLLAFGSHADVAHYFDVLSNSGLNALPEKHMLIFSRYLASHLPSFTPVKLKTADKISEISSSNLLPSDYKGDRVKAFKVSKGAMAAKFSLELPYDAGLTNVLAHGSELVPEITAWKGEDTGGRDLTLVENQQAQKALAVTAKLLPEDAPFNKLELQAELNLGGLPVAGIYRYRILLRPRSYVLPEWITKWNMRDTEIKIWHQRPQEFDGSKTYNLENFLGTLQGAVLSTTPPKVGDVYCYIRVDK
jgi:hypothetical protein